jgi:hypothetical protein
MKSRLLAHPLLPLATLLALLAGAAPAARAEAPPARGVDRRSMQAKEAFAAGRYDDALKIFVRLHAETQDPIYLRVIGRCYQNLHDPEPAIRAFRGYLDRSPRLDPAKRAEIEGYIQDMQALLAKQRAAQAAPAPPGPVAPLPPIAPPAAAPPPEPPASAATPPEPSAALTPPPPAPAVTPPAPVPPAPSLPAAPSSASRSPAAPGTALTADADRAAAPPAPDHTLRWTLLGVAGAAVAATAAFLLLRGPGDPGCKTGVICCPPGDLWCGGGNGH